MDIFFPYNNFQMSNQEFDHSTIERIFTNGYDKFTHENDFALVKLTKKISFTAPVQLDDGNISPNYDSSKKNLYAIGFGDLDPDAVIAQYPDRLHHVELSYMETQTCKDIYKDAGLAITDDMMCASDPFQDSCQGDSGGPLYDKDNNVVVGVVSFGEGKHTTCNDLSYRPT